MPTSRTIQCPSCGFQLQAGDMNLETMAGRCRVCQSLVDLRPEPAPASAAPAPLPVPLPERLSVSTADGGLLIERRWFSWTAIFMVFFCVLWFGFLAFWYVMALGSGNRTMLLVPLLHVAVGVFVLYTTAATLVNRTWIAVSSGRLTVRHGPLPWPGRRDLDTGALEQLFCDRHVHQSKNGTTVTYSVQVCGRDGKLVKLVTGLPDQNQAKYIEQQIERHLGIVDRPVGSGMF